MTYKEPWISDVICPHCGRNMMYRSTVTTETYFRALVVCRVCGTAQKIKHLLGSVEGETAESVGKQIYGGTRKLRSARREKANEG